MAAFKLTELDNLVAYKPPTTAKHQVFGSVVKRPSYEKGQYPAQLKPYAGQIRECPVKCAGRKGQEYVRCLKACASSVAKPAEEKISRRREYSKRYREMLKKMHPRVEVQPRI